MKGLRKGSIVTVFLSVTVGSLAVYSAALAGEKGAAAAEPAQPLWPAYVTDEIAKENGGVQSWGNIEVGARAYIQKPGDPARWVNPTLQPPVPESMAKFEEYGNVPAGVYLERLYVGGQTKDAEYYVDLRATDVANNNQRYIFDWAATGVAAGTLVWDQIPHLYSTTAQNIWQGVGTNYLTTSVSLGRLGLTGATPAQIAANTPFAILGGVGVKTYISNAISGVLSPIELGIQRDKFEADQRFTPTPNWEVRAGIATESRTGTQLTGVNWGGVGGPEMVQLPRPVSDTTNIGKVSGERTGEWAYGRYNVKLTGYVSTFENDYSSFTVQNPFYLSPTGSQISTGCDAAFATAAIASLPGTANPGVTPPCARVSLMPSNQAYTANLTSGIDLPFASRFMNTVQYVAMRQDEPFMPTTISTGNGPFRTTAANAPTPVGTAITNSAYSLNGEVDTLLVNNVVTTRLSDTLKSTLRYRYYENDNNTPTRSWNWVQEDSLNGVTRTPFGYTYSKQDASGDINYHILPNSSVGGTVGWQEIWREAREALTTDEVYGKLYGDSRWIDVGTFRASYQYSERRFDRYDPQAWYATIYPNGLAGTSNNWGERKFDLANRDRNQANALFTLDNIPFAPNLSITPSGGIRYDDYLTNPNNLVVVPANAYGTVNGSSVTTEMGLLKDNYWNAGIEAAYAFKPGTSIVLAYVHENYDKDLVGSNTLQNTANGCIGAAPACGGVVTRWGSNMKEDVDTLMVGANVALNDSFDFFASYSIAYGTENWTAFNIGGNSACAVPGSAAYLGGCMPFPEVTNNIQRIDAVLRYKFDSEFVTKAGFSGDVYWKLKYSWDLSRVENWQNDIVTPYMYLVDPSAAGRNISMAAYNPNYDVHLIATTLNFKW